MGMDSTHLHLEEEEKLFHKKKEGGGGEEDEDEEWNAHIVSISDTLFETCRAHIA